MKSLIRKSVWNGRRPRWQPDDKLIHALYRRAQFLEDEWPCARVSDTPGRMVDAALRHIPRLLKSGLVTEAELGDTRRAARILDRIWVRNARRDHQRYKARRPVRLTEDIPDRGNCFDRVHAADLLARTFKLLVGAGFRPDIVAGYILATQQWDCTQIALTLTQLYGSTYKASLIRKWKSRSVFGSISKRLRRRAAGLFPAEVQI